ncbi:MAG: dihydrofolate reductase [Pseudomonadota bacterium]
MTKPLISMIAAVSEDGVIGRDNSLPWRLSADLRYFRQRTMGKPVIMGRKTYESIGKPLKGRHNIVISGNRELAIEGVTVVHSLDAALECERDADEIMIIGGAQLYQAAMDIADRLYITRVHLKVPDGDARFPDFLGKTAVQWKTSCEHFLAGEQGDPDCTFFVYDRVRGAVALEANR